MPETLCLLLLETEDNGGRDREAVRFGPFCNESDDSIRRSSAGSDRWPTDGGVREPLDGEVLWLLVPSLDASVELSVRKLALERRRSCLRNDGAMMG